MLSGKIKSTFIMRIDATILNVLLTRKVIQKVCITLWTGVFMRIIMCCNDIFVMLAKTRHGSEFGTDGLFDTYLKSQILYKYFLLWLKQAIISGCSGVHFHKLCLLWLGYWIHHWCVKSYIASEGEKLQRWFVNVPRQIWPIIWLNISKTQLVV